MPSRTRGSSDRPVPALHWSTLAVTNMGKVAGIWIVVHDIHLHGTINPQNGAIAVLLIAGAQGLEDLILAIIKEVFKR